MACRLGWRALACGIGLVGCGVAAGAAWRDGLWGSLTGAVLVAIWLSALIWWFVVQRASTPSLTHETSREVAGDRLVLDAAPTPIVMIEGGSVRVLNRAARRLFGADDRVVPTPATLARSDEHYLRHEGRQYRIDRVALGGTTTERTVAALIDVEQEEQVAEARATAEMIHVLGHELLNGLAPIVSLAESGEAALDLPNPIRRCCAKSLRRWRGVPRVCSGLQKAIATLRGYPCRDGPPHPCRKWPMIWRACSRGDGRALR